MPQFLHELWMPHVDTRPEHCAVCWKGERIPYGELDRLTNQLARTLRANGSHPGDRVIVLMPNSANALFAILGILKAGCVAVPIDVTTPRNWLEKILEKTQPAAILAARTTGPILDELFAAHILGDRALPAVSIGTLEAMPIEGECFATAFSGLEILRQSADPIACRATPNSPALQCFSSSEVASGVSNATGSRVFEATAVTSTIPHPTSVSHADILVFLASSNAALNLTEFDRAAVLPMSSPLAMAGAFVALAAGSELHIVPQELLARPRQLAAFVRSHELTDWLTNHGLLSELVRSDAICDGDFPSLRRLLWSGDPLPVETLRALMQRLPLTQFARVAGPSNLRLSGLSLEIQSLPEMPVMPVSKPVREVVQV